MSMGSKKSGLMFTIQRKRFCLRIAYSKRLNKHLRSAFFEQNTKSRRNTFSEELSLNSVQFSRRVQVSEGHGC